MNNFYDILTDDDEVYLSCKKMNGHYYKERLAILEKQVISAFPALGGFLHTLPWESLPKADYDRLLKAVEGKGYKQRLKIFKAIEDKLRSKA